MRPTCSVWGVLLLGLLAASAGAQTLKTIAEIAIGTPDLVRRAHLKECSRPPSPPDSKESPV